MIEIKEKSKFSVGEVAKLVATSTRTIRYYEEIGLLEHPQRRGNRRVYSGEDLRRLKFIRRLKLLGLSLAEMSELKDIYKIHQSNRKVLSRLLELFERHIDKIEQSIEGLQTLKREIERYRERIHHKLNGNNGNGKPVGKSKGENK